jgi:hypothetical protein
MNNAMARNANATIHLRIFKMLRVFMVHSYSLEAGAVPFDSVSSPA